MRRSYASRRGITPKDYISVCGCKSAQRRRMARPAERLAYFWCDYACSTTLCEDAFRGQTTHLGPDVVLSIQPIWVPSSRDRSTSHLCDAASELRSGPPRPRGKGARPEPTKRHEHGRGTPSCEGRTLAADHGRGLR